MRPTLFVAALTASLAAFPLAAKESGGDTASPTAEASSVRLELAKQIIDLAYPQDTRIELFRKVSKQIETQMLESLEGIVTDDGAITIVTEWQTGMSTKTDEILVRNVPALMEGWVKAYSEIYSEQELRDILAFVSTPSGATFLAKTSEVTVHPDFASTNQGYMNEIMALIPAEIPTLVAKLREYKAEQDAAASE